MNPEERTVPQQRQYDQLRTSPRCSIRLHGQSYTPKFRSRWIKLVAISGGCDPEDVNPEKIVEHFGAPAKKWASRTVKPKSVSQH